MAKAYISAVSEQDITNELGTLQHNTISVHIKDKESAVEPRPTFPDGTRPATGDYGRGAFIHRGLPLYVTESQIANDTVTTSMTSTDLNPLATACFSILDAGSERITIVQNAGYTGAEGSIFYGSDAIDPSIENYTQTVSSFTTTADANNEEDVVAFSDDGTKMYTISGPTDDEVWEYDLSTAWDITTAAYNGVSYDSTEAAAGQGSVLEFGDSGTKMYLSDALNDVIYQYTLSTAWDLSTAAYASKSKDVSAQTASLWAMRFSTDGTTMVIIANEAVPKLYEYSCTAWDVSTASYVDSLSLSDIGASLSGGFCFNADGTTAYIAELGGVAKLREYTFSTGFDVSTGSHTQLGNTITGTPRIPFMNTITGDIYYITSGTNTIYKLSAGTSFIAVTDADAPGSTSDTIMTRGCPVLNGKLYTFGAITTNIHSSKVNTVDTWAATDIIAAEREGDYGCFLGKQRDHIVAIGTRSLELFYDEPTGSGSSLQSRRDIYYNVGSVFPNSCCQYGDDIYFFGTNAEGDTDLYKMTDFKLQPLSNPYIQTKLRELTVNAHNNPYTNEATNFKQVLTVFSTPRHGVILVMTINGTTFSFQPKTGHVAEWYPGADVSSSTGLFTEDWATDHLFPITGAYSYTPQGSTVYIMMANGYATSVEYDGDLDDFAGTATAAPSFFYLPKWNADTLHKKRVKSYHFHQFPNLDSGVTSSDFTVSWVNLEDSVDFGATLTDADFTNGRAVSSNYSAARLYRGGSTRERVHKILLTPQKSQLMAGIEIDYDILGT